MTSFTQEQYAEKIAALLRKAESTSPEEAEALVSKAQELMTTYSIDQSLMEAARAGQVDTDPIVIEKIEYHSIYSRAIYYIGSTIAKHNQCVPLINRGKDLMRTTLSVVGYERDVERVRMLDASLQIQAMRAMNQWWSTQDSSVYPTQREKFKVRREFLMGFANGLNTKLEHAQIEGEAAAARNEMERTGTKSEFEASESVALVVRSKQERLAEWMDENMRVGKGRSIRYARGTGQAQYAGREAGQRATLGEPASIGRDVKELSR